MSEINHIVKKLDEFKKYNPKSPENIYLGVDTLLRLKADPTLLRHWDMARQEPVKFMGMLVHEINQKEGVYFERPLEPITHCNITVNKPT